MSWPLLWNKIGFWATLGFAFFIPISTAGTNICIALVVLSWILGGQYAAKMLTCQKPFVIALGIWIAVTLAGGLYTSAEPVAFWGRISDTTRFLYIPFLMFYVESPRKMNTILWAFVLAMVLTLILGYLKMYGGLPIGTKFTTAAVFKSHIKTNFFMSVAAFYLAHQAKANPTYRKYFLFILGLMVYYIFFMSVGRIGYLTFIGFFLFFLWHALPINRVLASLSILVMMGVGVSLVYVASPQFASRVNALQHDWVLYQEGGRLVESSLGSRITFDLYSLELMQRHPILGWGTGSFKTAYQKIAKEKGDTFLTDNPHNEYLRVGVEFGLVGLLLLLGLLGYAWRLTRQLEGVDKHFCQGVLLMFCMGLLINSWLIDFTEGCFFSLITALIVAHASSKAPLWQSQQLFPLVS